LATTAYLNQQDRKFDPKVFERMVAEWQAACDQPFDEVDKPEFRRMIEYLHPGVHIPHHDATRRHIMKLGEETIKGTKEMIEVHFYLSYCS
jgi:hypothetical protein